MTSITRITNDPAAPPDPTATNIDQNAQSGTLVEEDAFLDPFGAVWAEVEKQFAEANPDLAPPDPDAPPAPAAPPDPAVPAADQDAEGSQPPTRDENDSQLLEGEAGQAASPAAQTPSLPDGGGEGGLTPPGPSAQVDASATPTPVLAPVQPAAPPTVDEWFAQLTPEQRAAVGQAITPQPAPAPTTPPAPAVPQFDPASLAVLDDVIPGFSAAYTAQQAQTAALTQELASTRALIDQQSASQVAQTQQQTFTRISQARDSWSAAHPEFAPSDIETLLSEAAQKVNYPSLVNQYGGDHHAATTEALNIAMASNPAAHDAYLKAEFAKMTGVQASIDQKIARQSGIAAPPGTVPRDMAPIDSSKMTDQQRTDAMIAEVAASMDR